MKNFCLIIITFDGITSRDRLMYLVDEMKYKEDPRDVDEERGAAVYSAALLWVHDGGGRLRETEDVTEGSIDALVMVRGEESFPVLSIKQTGHDNQTRRSCQSNKPVTSIKQGGLINPINWACQSPSKFCQSLAHTTHGWHSDEHS